MFVASDGTKFEDRNAWRKYEFETNYTFRDKANEKLVKLPGSINGQPFDLSDLNGCEVLLLDQSDQVQVDNLNNCHVFIGPCSESVFVRNCTDCTFTVACKQLRTRDCKSCSFQLYSLTDPIIETSHGMTFAPFNGAYHGIEQHFRDARLEPHNNHWAQVFDFNDPDKQGNNWKLIGEDQQVDEWVVSLEGLVENPTLLGQCTNPVARDAPCIQYVEKNDSSMKSFTFNTSQEEAQKHIQPVSIGKSDPALGVVATAPNQSEIPESDANPVPPPAPWTFPAKIAPGTPSEIGESNLLQQDAQAHHLLPKALPNPEHESGTQRSAGHTKIEEMRIDNVCEAHKDPVVVQELAAAMATL